MSQVLVAECILVQHSHAGLRRSLTVVILDRVSSLSSLITKRTRTSKKDWSSHLSWGESYEGMSIYWCGHKQYLTYLCGWPQGGNPGFPNSFLSSQRIDPACIIVANEVLEV